MKKYITRSGFTLVELMVVVSVIGILSAIVYANFGSARAAARDDVRKSALKEVQLALQLYKAQYGVYPDQGCGNNAGKSPSGIWSGPGYTVGGAVACDQYIVGLVPEFIAALPMDPIFDEQNAVDAGYVYKSSGTDYKLIALSAAEVKMVDNYEHEYARCDRAYAGKNWCDTGTAMFSSTYAVYSSGAADW
jgi:prepilin-type N-terminal cleavage/methylation domain-containing protein